MTDDKVVELLKALGDEDDEVRMNAAEALVNIDALAVEPLIKALGDEDWYIRGNAATALGLIGDARAVEPLIKALGEKDWDVRKKAAAALGKIGDSRAVEPLINALGDNGEEVRLNAAEALGKIGEPAVEPLINTLKNIDLYFRYCAAEALGKIGEPAVEPLINTLKDKNKGVRMSAAEALDRIGWRPTLGIQKVYYYIAKQNWEQVTSLGSPAVEPLIKALGDDNSSIREEVAIALGKICPQITTVTFGEFSTNRDKMTLNNPDVEALTITLKNIQKVLVNSKNYDLRLMQKFITYAVNYIGQKHLRENVEVHIYGNSDMLDPNLRNSFHNLFKKVEFLGGLNFENFY